MTPQRYEEQIKQVDRLRLLNEKILERFFKFQIYKNFL